MKTLSVAAKAIGLLFIECVTLYVITINKMTIIRNNPMLKFTSMITV